MFAIGDDSQISFATEGFASRLETTPEALAGTPVGSVLKTESGEDLEGVVSELQAAPPGTTRRCRLVAGPKGGSASVAVELATATGPEVVGTLQQDSDVDGRYRHLFEQSTDAVVSFEIIDMEPVVWTVNTAFVETFGYDRDEISGESLNDFIVPEEHAEEAAGYDRRTAAGETNRALITRKTVEGKRDFVYRGLSYESTEGNRCGFAIYTDVTDDRRLRRRLQVLHRVLRHNLRNDLTVIVGMADHILETAASSEQRQAANRILTTAERLCSVSEQARDVEVALDSDSDRSVDATELVQSVVSTYPDEEIETDVPGSALVAGGTAVYDAVDNLVDNAVVHTPPGTDIRVTVRAESGGTVIRVADDGPGIAAIERAVVLEDEDITRLKHGSGLGLWLARWIAEAAGGECQYDRVDGWTVITLWLPSADNRGPLVPDDVGGPESAVSGQ